MIETWTDQQPVSDLLASHLGMGIKIERAIGADADRPAVIRGVLEQIVHAHDGTTLRVRLWRDSVELRFPKNDTLLVALFEPRRG